MMCFVVFSFEEDWFLNFAISKNEFLTLFWYFLIGWKSRTDWLGSFNGYSRIGWNVCSVFGRSRMTRLRPQRYQILLIWVLWVEWYHFQFQQIKHQRWTGWGDEGSLDGYGEYGSQKWSNVLDVFWHGEQDVINANFRGTSYTRFSLLFGLYRKVRDF